MPKRSKPTVDFHQHRFMQISEAHCGPAVIQMLLSRLDADMTQLEVAEAGEATNPMAVASPAIDREMMPLGLQLKDSS